MKALKRRRRPPVKISPLVFPVLLAAANFLPLSYMIGFFAAVAAHEAGHVFALKMMKCPIYGVEFSPGGVILECSPKSYKDDLISAAAGPAASFLFAAVIAVFSAPSGGTPSAFYISLLLGFLNLLPVEGLDGGRALSAFLAQKSGLPPPRPAEAFINAAALMLLLIVSCFLLLRTGDNPTMLVFCLGAMMKGEREAA